jgi:hypothetical protein
MLWGLADHYVGEVIQVYRSRARAERALAAVLADEPEWEGMMAVIAIPQPCDRDWSPKGKPMRRPRCRGV